MVLSFVVKHDCWDRHEGVRLNGTLTIKELKERIAAFEALFGAKPDVFFDAQWCGYRACRAADSSGFRPNGPTRVTRVGTRWITIDLGEEGRVEVDPAMSSVERPRWILALPDDHKAAMNAAASAGHG